jgi:DNA polymerase III subunit epsilon
MGEFIAIDFETANAKRVSACALGLVRVSGGKIVEKAGGLIRPVGGHAPFQTNIHKITEEQTREKPDFSELFPGIRRMFDYPLVGYSLFDKQVLDALSSHFSLAFEFTYVDCCAAAKDKLPQLKNHKLKTVSRHFGLPEFKHHDATEDAVACANIFLKLQDLSGTESQASSVQSVHDFQRLATGILADSRVDYKEAYELLYWLEDNPAFAEEYSRLRDTVREVLDDGHLDDFEAGRLYEILRLTLEHLG